jgi:hypothetical protein
MPHNLSPAAPAVQRILKPVRAEASQTPVGVRRLRRARSRAVLLFRWRARAFVRAVLGKGVAR